MAQLSLFPETGGPKSRDAYSWQAYLSSALTEADQSVLDLNEKVADWLEADADTFVYLPQRYSKPGAGDTMTPEEIYILDRWRITESDFVIMNLEMASFGVGQEAEIATSMGIPVIAFHSKAKRVSRIMRGMPGHFAHGNPSEAVIEFTSHDDLRRQLAHRINTLRDYLADVRDRAPDHHADFSQKLQAAILNSGKPPAEVARIAGISPAFLNVLLHHKGVVRHLMERHALGDRCPVLDAPLNRYLNPGLWVIQNLAAALDITVEQLLAEEIQTRWDEPLVHLAEAGVSLKQFLSVLDRHDYHILYKNVAAGGNARHVADEILKSLANSDECPQPTS